MKRTNPLAKFAMPITLATSIFSPNLETLAEQPTSQPVKKIIVLDPGHGMGNGTENVYDPGAIFTEGQRTYKESEMVLEQAKELEKLLEDKGYDVRLTREDQTTNTSLKSRSDYSNSQNPDAFVSLHINSFTNNDAHGVRTYFFNGRDEGKDLAKKIRESIVSALDEKIENFDKDYIGNKTESANFSVLRNANSSIPAVLVETGFISNDNDREYLTNEANTLSTAIATGIINYFDSINQQPTSRPAEPTTQPSTEYKTYTIQKGDTLWAISRNLGLKTEQLQDWNPNTDPRKLQIGQEIKYLSE